MSTFRRVSACALTFAVLGGFLAAVPAGAQDESAVTVTAPERFVTGASARGLNLSLLGNNITVGASSALINSTPKAEATGAGVLLVGGTVAEASVVAANQTQTPPNACILDLPLGILNLSAACGEAKATTANGLPQAAAVGSVAGIDLGLSLLDPLIDQLLALVDQTVGVVVNDLTALLGGLLDPLLGALDLNLDSLVGDLLDGLRQATGVLTVRLGSSAAQATTDTSAVNSIGEAAGAEIDVLPGLSPLGAPLARIIVGNAKASVNITRPAAATSATTAVATPSFEAALVRVILGLPVLGALTDIPIGLGAPLTLLAGTPLESTISIGAGTTGTGENGTVFAIADGVSLQLLKGLSGGIGLELAHAEASGGGQSATFTVAQKVIPVPAAPPAPQLARTGGDTPWVPMAGMALLLAAFVVRRLAGAAR